MKISQAHLSHPKYRPDIDGLRAIAVIAVLAFHAFPNWVRGGFIGVDVFFVISGYLISIIIFDNLDKGTFSFTKFYARRIKRIFPALIIVLVACFTFGWFTLLTDEFKQLGKHIAAGAGFVSNFVLWDEAGYFDNSAETKPLLHLWSLGIEEQFYIVWPLLLWLAWKNKFNLLKITILLAVISFALNVKGIKQDAVATFYSPHTRFWELLCGSILAWFTLYKKSTYQNIFIKLDGFLALVIYRDKKKADGKSLANVTSFIGLLLLLYGFWQINKELSFPGKWALIPVLGAVLIIMAGSKAWVNRTILSNRIMVWFGLISFPLYLWHWPLLSFARIIEGEVPSRNLRIALVILSIALAWLTYRFIERPVRFGNYKNRLKIILLCSCALITGFLGFCVDKFDFSKSRPYENLLFQRKGFEHMYGSSLNWYEGKENWVFLGNIHDNKVAKIKLANIPNNEQINALHKQFSDIAEAGAKTNTKIVLFIGPNKSSIYPEYLPDKLVPSNTKYISYFLDNLKDIPNLTIVNPTDDLLRLKNTEGILYWRKDSHWNNKGAYLAYSVFCKQLGLPDPQVDFQRGRPWSNIFSPPFSELNNIPLHADDSWDVIWKNKPNWKEKEVENVQKNPAFGPITKVTNLAPLSDKTIWVVGDSFSGSLRQYFNSTFKEIFYVGHLGNTLNDLPTDLAKAEKKPDILVIVRVERSF
jgi:peptidoglycan/LPS O-acetylase OafA/YrhL